MLGDVGAPEIGYVCPGRAFPEGTRAHQTHRRNGQAGTREISSAKECVVAEGVLPHHLVFGRFDRLYHCQLLIRRTCLPSSRLSPTERPPAHSLPSLPHGLGRVVSPSARLLDLSRAVGVEARGTG